jgi:hypothetical protein
MRTCKYRTQQSDWKGKTSAGIDEAWNGSPGVPSKKFHMIYYTQKRLGANHEHSVPGE